MRRRTDATVDCGIELRSFDLAMHLLQNRNRKFNLILNLSLHILMMLSKSLHILMIPSSFVYHLILQISSSFFASFAIRLSLVCELFDCYARTLCLMMIMLVFSYSTPFPIPSTPSLPPPIPCHSLRMLCHARLYVDTSQLFSTIKKLIILWAFAVCFYLLMEYVFINIDN